MSPDRDIERIVLIGFMASGKSTVGRQVATLLDWDFIDFDEEIERRTARTVRDIFAQDGERAFRDLEARLTAELAAAQHVVLAPGGGWITQPELLRAMPDGTHVVWLRISPERAVERARLSGTHRPLLAGEDPLGKAVRLLERREPLYRMADTVLDVDDRSVRELADEIVRSLSRSRAGR